MWVAAKQHGELEVMTEERSFGVDSVGAMWSGGVSLSKLLISPFVCCGIGVALTKTRFPGNARALRTLSRSILCLVIPLIAAGLFCGCQTKVAVAHRPLENLDCQPAPEVKEIVHSRLSTFHKASDEVGYHTFSLFALPLIQMRSKPETTVVDAVAEAIEEALETANYSLAGRDPLRELQDGPEVRGTLVKFYYWSYMWLWPIMLQGGRTHFKLEVVDEAGTVLWAKLVKKASFWPTLFGSYGFNGIIRSDLTGIAKKTQAAVAEASFQEALKGVQQPLQVSSESQMKSGKPRRQAGRR